MEQSGNSVRVAAPLRERGNGENRRIGRSRQGDDCASCRSPFGAFGALREKRPPRPATGVEERAPETPRVHRTSGPFAPFPPCPRRKRRFGATFGTIRAETPLSLFCCSATFLLEPRCRGSYVALQQEPKG